METVDRMEGLRLRAAYKRYLPGSALPWERNPLIVRKALEALLTEHPIETLNLFPFDRLREQITSMWVPFDEENLMSQIDMEHPEWIVPPATGEAGGDRMEPYWRAYEERLSAVEEFESTAIDSAAQRLQATIYKRSMAERERRKPPGKSTHAQFRHDRLIKKTDWFL